MRENHTISFRASAEVYATLEQITHQEAHGSISHYLRGLVMADLGRRRISKKTLQRTLPKSLDARKHHRFSLAALDNA